MSDKVLRTRRIPNEDRLEAIIALLRAEVQAWRDADESRDEERLPWDKAQAIIKAMNATDAAGALEDK